jgi:hypothetical protein
MTARACGPILTGRRVLVVEDEALIAMQIEAELEDAPLYHRRTIGGGMLRKQHQIK